MNYRFDILLIKPNHPFCEKSCYYFEEFFNKVLNIDTLDEPLQNINKNLLHDYIKSKSDFLDMMNVEFDKLLYLMYTTINPADADNRAFDVKTCFNDKNTLIMYTYDQSIVDENQYNHIATLLNPTFEAVFGPVFLTKMSKDDNDKVIKHENISVDDFIDLWIGLKQIYYWKFINKTWHREYMLNNNKHMCDYNFVDINNYIFFFKFKNSKNIEESYIKEFIINNIDNITELDKKFSCLKICKLRLNEYVSCSYNTDLETINEEVIKSIKNVYSSNKDVIMECLFIDIEKKLPKLK